MQALHSSIPRVPGRPVYVQGEAPKGLLLEKFRAAKNAILVATMSFWEGVDVPGQALRLIVIDKIPFQVPTNPVVMARSASIEQSGKSPFAHYHVPSAAITLKQGFRTLDSHEARRRHRRDFGQAHPHQELRPRAHREPSPSAPHRGSRGD